MKLIPLSIIVLSFSLLFFAQDANAGFFSWGKKKELKQTETAVRFKNEKQDRRIIVVEIYAKWCPLCKNIEPMIDLLQKQDKELRIIKLDVSNREMVNYSQKLARRLRIESFFNVNKNKTSKVAVFAPSTREVVEEFVNENDITKIKNAIKKARTIEKALETL